MKVLDLRCVDHHRFEGWFASADEFQSQAERRLVTCPICNSADVLRLPSAPRLNRSKADEAPTTVPAERRNDVARTEAQAQWLQAMRKVVAGSEDVGDRFAHEARRIHHHEAEARSIRGQASGEEVASLRDEGIEVVQLAVPEMLKGRVH